jgi:hypothetical protein
MLMPRERPNRKAPDIDVLARHYLKRGLSQHAEITKHVQDVDVVEKMEMWALLDLAKKMGVDPDEMIRKTEQEERVRSDWSWKHPAFRGELPFDLTLTFLGQNVTRKAKLIYEHTPEWPYYDQLKQEEYTGWEGTKYHIELAAVPQEYHDDGTMTEGEPEWFHAEDITHDGVLPDKVWNAVLDAVDEKCKAEDAERRRVMAIRRAARSPKSKSKH